MMMMTQVEPPYGVAPSVRSATSQRWNKSFLKTYYQNIYKAAQNPDSVDGDSQKFLQRASKPYSGPTCTRVQQLKAAKTLVSSNAKNWFPFCWTQWNVISPYNLRSDMKSPVSSMAKNINPYPNIRSEKSPVHNACIVHLDAKRTKMLRSFWLVKPWLLCIRCSGDFLEKFNIQSLSLMKKLILRV